MDNCFRRFAEVKVKEQWSHGNQTWTAIGNIDTYVIGMMMIVILIVINTIINIIVIYKSNQ